MKLTRVFALLFTALFFSSNALAQIGYRQLVTTDRILNEKVYGEIAEEQAVYAYKKEKAEELMRLQADRFQEMQVKGL